MSLTYKKPSSAVYINVTLYLDTPGYSLVKFPLGPRLKLLTPLTEGCADGFPHLLTLFFSHVKKRHKKWIKIRSVESELELRLYAIFTFG